MAENDVLKQIEQNLSQGEVEAPVEQVAVKEEPKEVTQAPEPTQRQETSERRLSRREQAAKKNADEIAYLRAQLQERETKLNSNSERLQKLEKLSPLLDEVEQYQKNQKNQSLREKLNGIDPEFVNKLVEENVNAQLKPYKDQADFVQKQNFVAESLQSMRQWSSSDQEHDAVVNVIPEFFRNNINNFGEDRGRQYNRALAENPEFLFRYLRDLYRESMERNRTSQAQEGLNKKKELADLNGSVSRPNQVNNTKSDKNQARKQIDDFLLNMAGQRRQ